MGLVIWQLLGAAAASQGPGPWPIPGGMALEPLVAESRMLWGRGQPLQHQGFCNLLQALFKLGKKVKYHPRTHE